MFKSPVTLFFGFALLLTGVGAKADFITNGSFETITGPVGQIGYNGNTLPGWSNNNGSGGSLGYNFIFASGTADTSGSNGTSGNVTLWGPNDGSANGLPASSPDGGNFIAADGTYETGAITQTITGLQAGRTYQVGFWWAGAQQHGFDYPTTEQWLVSLGSQQLATNIVNDPSHSFTGWTHTYLTFTATDSSELLAFLANGGPAGGEPPFSLLDGVTMNEVPEPASMSLLAAGLVALGYARRRKQYQA